MIVDGPAVTRESALAWERTQIEKYWLEYVRYHHEDRTNLGLEKGTPDRRIRSVASFLRSDSAGCTIVTIEPPSSTRRVEARMVFRLPSP
jgi:hypothetical protein